MVAFTLPLYIYLHSLHQPLTLKPITTFLSYTALVKTVQCLCVSMQHHSSCHSTWLCSGTLQLDRSDRTTQQQPCILWQLVYHALIPISFLMHKSDGLQCSRSLSSSAACVFGYFSLPSVLGPSRPSIIYKGFFFSFFPFGKRGKWKSWTWRQGGHRMLSSLCHVYFLF